MTTIPNLGLTHLQPNSSQPEVPVSALANGLDKEGNTKLPWTITGSTTVTQAQLTSAALHVLGGTPGAGFNFDLPADVERLFTVKNDSGQTATVQVSGGARANVGVPTGTTRIPHSDGTDVIALA